MFQIIALMYIRTVLKLFIQFYSILSVEDQFLVLRIMTEFESLLTHKIVLLKIEMLQFYY